MNKFSENRQGGILGELQHLERLQNAKKTLDRELYQECQLNSNSTRHGVFHKNRFSSHPGRFDSDNSDSSILRNSPCNSPRRVCLSSKEMVDVNLEDDETTVSKFRKKLHEKLTFTKERDTFELEMAVGDSPKNVRPIVPTINTIRDTEESGTTIRKKNIFTISNQPSKSVSQKYLMMSETMFEKKFKMFVEKSLHTLNDIRSLLEKGIDPPDGVEDVVRRQHRVKEFSNRFSRNYLYPLVRQLEDLNRWKPSNQNGNQKLLSSYQIILNGLQAYQNHLPTSIGGCSSDKLKQLLEHLLDLCNIHNRMMNMESGENSYVEFLCTIKLHAEATLQKIEDHFTAISAESMLKSTATKLSLQHFRADPKNNKSKLKRNNIEERLSMYTATSSFRKDPLWKKTAEALAKKKLNVKSRYKTSNYKHRPPLEKPSGTQIPSKCHLFARKSSNILKKTPVMTPINEDSIPTMVQMEERNNENVEEKTDETKVESFNHEEIVMKLLRLVLDSNSDREAGNAENAKKISEFLEQLRREGDVETLQKVFVTLQERRQSQEQLELRVLRSSDGIEDGILKKRKEPTVTVSGARNAKLICIKDENSDVEADAGDAPQLQGVAAPDKAAPRAATAAVGMRRLRRTSRCLQMPPGEWAVRIVQYKIDFHRHCKGSPMYRRTASVLPWELMARISDEILDFALLSVAKEIEVNDIVNNIYQSELQL